MQCENNRVDGNTPHTDYISEAKVPDENARNPEDVKSISANKKQSSKPKLQSPMLFPEFQTANLSRLFMVTCTQLRWNLKDLK
ncbi:hypothetical protein CEXT_217321 [Caerostris extrusa]|uniref:Uncharacterized protein n=1 Tax=Caerostris extrusa TaxID=172846 RepID=A0AAV4SKK8_CAEEX|nr:hypothetical protein CEXT_217321 [Caerostris extrusa]